MEVMIYLYIYKKRDEDTPLRKVLRDSGTHLLLFADFFSQWGLKMFALIQTWNYGFLFVLCGDECRDST